MRYVLGIDAGGTKTVGLLAEETGRVVAEARGKVNAVSTLVDLARDGVAL